MRPGRRRINTFSDDSVRRIGGTVRAVDGILRSQSPPVVGGMGDDGEALLCKTTAAWSKGTSATLQVWAGTAGSETDTGITVTAWNRYGTVASGKFCSVMLHRGGGYYLIAADCE